MAKASNKGQEGVGANSSDLAPAFVTERKSDIRGMILNTGKLGLQLFSGFATRDGGLAGEIHTTLRTIKSDFLGVRTVRVSDSEITPAGISEDPRFDSLQ